MIALPDLHLQQPRRFSDIVVMPTQAIFDAATGTAFRGGPVWPRFRFQVSPRHCHGPFPIPCDSRPDPIETPHETVDAGLWCGPVSHHFGHMIADFSMRIAASAAYDETTPLVFSLLLGVIEPPRFFWEITDHLKVNRSRILLIRHPTLFRTLIAYPQAERRYGGGPSRVHLDRMDQRVGGPIEPDLPCLFVSRARLIAQETLPVGQVAGEVYLDEVTKAAGATVMHPETLSLAAQLAAYRRSRLIVFSEGSAVHALQLLGRVDARVAVIVRRPGLRLAAASLRPRVRALHYVSAGAGQLHGLRQSGRPYRMRAMTVLRPERLLAGLCAAGLDLAPFWDMARYRRLSEASIEAWTQSTISMGSHPGSATAIDQCWKRLRP